MNVPLFDLRRYLSVLCVALLATACEGRPRAIGDGWHHGPKASAHRAFEDSLFALSSAPDPIAYLGIQPGADGDDLVLRATGGMSGETWAKALVAMGRLSVVVGHPGSSVTNAAARVYAELGVPLIAPNATARAEPEVEDWVFRLLPDDGVQGRFLADYAVDSVKGSRIAVVFAGDAYGVGILRGVRTALARRGLLIADEVELPAAPCSLNELSAAGTATRAMLRRAKPDVIIIALALEPANCVMNEALRTRPNMAILGADALDEVDLDRWTKNNFPAARIQVATGWRPRTDSVTLHFIESFARHSGRRPSGSDALWHDAMSLATLAVRETDGSPEQVRRWLASLGESREPVLGLTGPIAFAGDRGVRFFMRTLE